jgi:hypothetical protein
MSLPEDQYIPPQLPFPIISTTATSPPNNHHHEINHTPQLVHHHDTTNAVTTHPESQVCYENDFWIDRKNWTFLNHGAFGGAVRVGYHRAAQWRHYTELQPLRYYDRQLLPHLVYATRCMAQFMNVIVPQSHFVVLPNVTSGLNAVLAGHCRLFGSGNNNNNNNSSAHCILWDTTYGSVKKMAQHYYHSPNNITEIPFQAQYLHHLAAAVTRSGGSTTTTQPEQVFVDALDDCLTKNQQLLEQKHVCFVLDHVTSNTAFTMPIELLARHMKDRIPNCTVVVDGAHALLMHDVNIQQYFQSGCIDIYVTNGHKWFAAPKGVAFMAVNPQNDIANAIVQRPAVISHGVDEMDLFSRYVWDGCRDYNAALAIPAVINYWQQFDRTVMRQMAKDKLRRGVHILACAWHAHHTSAPAVSSDTTTTTKVDTSSWPGVVTLVDFESSVVSSFMVLVQLPLFLRFDDAQVGSPNYTSVHAKMVQDYLFHHQIEVPIKCINGKLYVRVSCHIYNTLNDFEQLAHCLLKMPYR